MPHLLKKRQTVHDRKVREVARRLRKAGYFVRADLPGHKKPPKIGGFLFPHFCLTGYFGSFTICFSTIRRVQMRATLFEEVSMPTATQSQPEALPMSPRDELDLLEKKALERGITIEELERSWSFGFCPEQVQLRIEELHRWLNAH